MNYVRGPLSPDPYGGIYETYCSGTFNMFATESVFGGKLPACTVSSISYQTVRVAEGGNSSP